MRSACTRWKQALTVLIALLVIITFTACTQKSATDTNTNTPSATETLPVTNTPPVPSAPPPLPGQLPKIWHSESTKHDFRVEVTKDLFRADWVNVPPSAAKQGASIRTECRRAGDKWVGSSTVKMLFAIPGAPAGKDTKLCSLTVRFEVDSISAEEITGHSEALHSFDVNTCRVQETKWGDFTWIPKK